MHWNTWRRKMRKLNLSRPFWWNSFPWHGSQPVYFLAYRVWFIRFGNSTTLTQIIYTFRINFCTFPYENIVSFPKFILPFCYCQITVESAHRCWMGSGIIIQYFSRIWLFHKCTVFSFWSFWFSAWFSCQSACSK